MQVERINPYRLRIQIERMVDDQKAYDQQVVAESITRYLTQQTQRYEAVRNVEAEQWLNHCLNVKV